ARQGMVSAPHYRGGGVVFGPHPRDYHQRLPRKMRRLALRSALSDKTTSGGLIPAPTVDAGGGPTKAVLTMLEAIGAQGRTILVVPEPDALVRRASGNLQNVRVVLPNGLSLLEIMQAGAIVLHRDAVERVTQLLLGEVAEAPAA